MTVYFDPADEPDGIAYHGEQYEAWMAEHPEQVFQENFQRWADMMAEDGIYPVTQDDYLAYLENQV